MCDDEDYLNVNIAKWMIAELFLKNYELTKANARLEIKLSAAEDYIAQSRSAQQAIDEMVAREAEKLKGKK